MKRTLSVFLGAAGAALALAIIKALVVSGLDTLPPVRVLFFAASMFGLLAVLLDWALLRPRRAGSKPAPGEVPVPRAAATKADPALQTGEIIARARLRPIVFREHCPPSASLSFYGGAPVGPVHLAWPRDSKDVPFTFIMQWECSALAPQDVTGLLPRDGVLYLFAHLDWSGFRFVHAPGPVADWRALPLPPQLPPVYGEGGAHAVPYCSPRVPEPVQDVPRLLSKWSFTPVAIPFAAAPAQDGEALFWHDVPAAGEALLGVEYPEGAPPAKHLESQRHEFGRPFSAFPHDYAAIRVVTAKVLESLRYPTSRTSPRTSKEEREAEFQRWRDEASERYAAAVAHHPAERLEQSASDEMWQWIAGLESVLRPGWNSVVESCVNVSLGLGTPAELFPAHLIAICAQRHRLAVDYLHEEYPDRRTPEALAAWEKRKAGGKLQEVREVHAPCPNHMFGPPSYVQGYVEEHVQDSLLLLELSSREAIGHDFGEGVLQFMIRPGDLQAGRFENATLIASAY